MHDLEGECKRASAIVADVCNDLVGYNVSNYPYTNKPHPTRDVIDIYSFTSRDIIVAERIEIFNAVYGALELMTLVPKIDEWYVLEVASSIATTLRNSTIQRGFGAFTHHAKIGSNFNGETTFKTGV